LSSTANAESTILCINGGSSSLKVALYRMGSAEELLLSGAAEDIGHLGRGKVGRFWIRSADQTLADSEEKFSDHGQALTRILHELRRQGDHAFSAAGHRIVHGGPRLTQPKRISPQIVDELKKIFAFAPLHLPVQTALIEEVARQYPELPQVACFDTAFHAGMPEVAQRFALPRSLWDAGVKRYGFHGLSYEYVVRTMGSDLGRRAVIAHLGNGASMVALNNGKSLDTSMGLTPTGGFMMGTRSGDLDPGIILFLLRSGQSVEDIADMLDHQSGLKGVSDGESDMKALLVRRETDKDAALAVEMFCYQIAKYVGSCAAVLNGLDTLVFTGGIGEHAAEIREGVTKRLAFLGIDLDPDANASHSAVITRRHSRCVVAVLPTNEDLMIARHTLSLI
jgi:acetate kinase